jgi:uncharacterized protein YutE (UPF0331/DUF86 family)
MVEHILAKRILESLQASLHHLESKKGISLSAYRKNEDMQAIVERRLETAIQACIDLGNHIISHDQLGRPDDYAEIFSILNRHSVISEALEKTMRKMVGFRNLLIHQYRDVLVDMVHKILHENLDDFYQFARAIMAYVNNKKGQPSE